MKSQSVAFHDEGTVRPDRLSFLPGSHLYCLLLVVFARPSCVIRVNVLHGRNPIDRHVRVGKIDYS